MRKISLVLIFVILLSCFASCSFSFAEVIDTITLTAPAFENGGNPAGNGFSWSGEYAYSWGLGTQLCSQVSTTTATFTFDVEKAGSYAVYMRKMSVLIFVTQRIFLTVIPALLSEEMKQMLFSNIWIGAVLLCGGTFAFSSLIIALSNRILWLKKLY